MCLCRTGPQARKDARTRNIARQVAIGVGDLGLAYQAFKIAISVDPNHAESYNNIGVLELRKALFDACFHKKAGMRRKESAGLLRAKVKSKSMLSCSVGVCMLDRKRVVGRLPSFVQANVYCNYIYIYIHKYIIA